MTILETVSGDNSVAITGTATGSNSLGVLGIGDGTTGGAGVSGEHKSTGVGVLAKSNLGVGIWATSEGHEGVHAETHSAVTAAIAGFNLNPAGTGAAIYGEHKFNGIGVLGKSNTSVGVWATSSTYEAVHAETQSPGTAAIAAYNLNPSGTGAAIYAKKVGSAGHAGFFDGNVFVTGDISCLNADCAEDFDIEEQSEVDPGSVVVIGEDGRLRECEAAYDKRVAGVISGAGGYKPAFVLDKQCGGGNRKPVALVGKVYCKVDADFAAISVGDLLTTSATRGHAMKIGEPHEGFGAVIGKALRPLQRGRGLIPILVALQ